MPLWSNEVWRARIGSSWCALGRTFNRRLTKNRNKSRRDLSTHQALAMVIVIIVFIAANVGLCATQRHHKNLLCNVPVTTAKRLLFNVLILLQAQSFVQMLLLLMCGDIESNPGPGLYPDLDYDSVDSSAVLTEDDLRDVYREVVDIQTTYYHFGLELGLPPRELDVIRKVHERDISQCITEVLLAWLRHCYNVQKYGPPTWRRIVEAVDSPFGGNSHAVAKDIAARHTSGPKPDIPSSYTCHSRESQDEVPQPKRCKADPSQPPPSQVELSTCNLHRWRQMLVDSYLAQECSRDVWPPLKMVKFVKLALVKQDTQDFHMNLHTIQKNVDEVYGTKTNVNYNDIFQNLDNGSLVLFEGRPGSGKTSLMVRVSCDWGRGNILKSKLLIFVRLRHLDKTKDIRLRDLLLNACPALSTDDSDLNGLSSYIDRSLGEDVVFVLDGFDEYYPGTNDESYIFKLILKLVYSRSIVVLSSRPAATQCFRQDASVWIEVVGFMKEQVLQYINDYFKEDKEKSSSLLKHLQEHQNLMNLCYLPLHCAMLVYLYKASNTTLPNTETEFYRDFTLSLLFRGICKQSTKLPKLKSLTFNCLSDEAKKALKKVCKLAYDATVARRQVFEESELQDICFNNNSENSETLGLVVIDRYFAKAGVDETYTFLHLTLQEYLAAFFLSELSVSNQVKMIASHFAEKHLFVMWRFLFGTLDYSKKSTMRLFNLMLRATRNDLLHHILCAYESQHRDACTDVVNFHNKHLEFRDITNSSDVFCITRVLEFAQYDVIELFLRTCNFDFHNAKAILQGACAFGTRQLILIVNGGIALKSMSDALKFVNVPNLIELNLTSDPSPKRYASMNLNDLKFSTNLRKLILNGINIFNCGLEAGFRSWPNLNILAIGDTSCPVAVLEGIKHCANLVELSLHLCCIGTSEIEVLVKSLRYTSKLQKFTLSNNTAGDDGLHVLSFYLKNYCKELKELRLWSMNLTDRSITCLTECIKVCNNLTLLDLRMNYFSKGGSELIQEAELARNRTCANKVELNIGYQRPS